MGIIRINQEVRHVTEDEHVHSSFSKYFLVSSYVIAVSEGLSESSSESACAYSCNQEKCIRKWLIIEYVIITAILFFNLHRGLPCN